jgi:sulfite exporter TauE/SafE/copper chaperone CopZ
MSSSLTKITLYIKNMTCINCENTIERELSKEPGIINVSASYSTGTVTITFDESLVSIARIIEILEKHDYYVKEEASTNGKKTNKINDQRAETSGRASKSNSDYTNLAGTAIIIFAIYLLARRLGLWNVFYSFPVAKEGMGYGMLFIIGLLTSVHCVAMCGGICMSQCVPKDIGENTFIGRFTAMRPSLLYNLGRVISYTVLGGMIGAIGSVVSFSGAMKGSVQILAGIFMMIMGINMLGVFPWLRRLNPHMPKLFAKKIYAQRNSNSPLYIGLLNGFMPCGPLQAMQLYALSTGSPLKGAIAMFIFSIGTVPLMFAFGALSSLLSKKFTKKLGTVSAVLVVILGVFMFNNGIGLSGLMLPSLSSAANTTQTDNIASVEDDVQIVTTGLSSGRYEPIVVQKGIPVKWIIQAEDGDINGCNNSIVVQKYGIQKSLKVGDNVIEFTPTESGTFPYSCWMGMIRSKITVVDDLNSIDSSALKDGSSTTSVGGGCCAGGAY